MIRLRPLSSWRASVSTVASSLSARSRASAADPGFLGQPLVGQHQADAVARRIATLCPPSCSAPAPGERS